MSLQQRPAQPIEKGTESPTSAKPLSFPRYSAAVLRRAWKEAREEFGLNWKTAWKTAVAMLVYGVGLWWWFHKASTEAVVITMIFKLSHLVDAILPTLITIGLLIFLFISKGAYLLYKERSEAADKLAELFGKPRIKSTGEFIDESGFMRADKQPYYLTIGLNLTETRPADNRILSYELTVEMDGQTLTGKPSAVGGNLTLLSTGERRDDLDKTEHRVLRQNDPQDGWLRFVFWEGKDFRNRDYILTVTDVYEVSREIRGKTPSEMDDTNTVGRKRRMSDRAFGG